jgi:serine/threonine protein kinase
MLAYSRKQRDHKSNRKTRKIGGRYVGEGSYGCGFAPALRCKGETVRQFGLFTKLMATRDALKEKVIGDILRRIDPKQSFILYPVTVCDVNQTVLGPSNPENNIASCKKGFASNLRQGAAVQYVDGGIDLNKIKLESQDILPFLKGLTNLLKGLFKLHYHRVTHNDIKPENVVALKRQDGSFHIRLIDINFVQEMNMPIESDKPFDANYFVWPFEMRFTVDQGGYGLTSEIKDWHKTVTKIKYVPPEVYFDDTTKNFILDSTLAKSILGKVQTAAETLVKADEIDRDIKVEQKIIEMILRKVDVYSTGSLLAFCYSKTILHKMVDGVIYTQVPWSSTYIQINELGAKGMNDESAKWHADVATNISIPLYKLCKKMMHVDPEKRPYFPIAFLRYKRLLKYMNAYFKKEMIEKHILNPARKP